MQFLPVTAATAAFLALMTVVLSGLTSLRRAQLKTSFGDADDTALRRRSRAHGNFAEYAPMALILVALIEAFGVAHATVIALAGTLCFARLLHAIGMLFMKGAALKAVAMFLQHASFVYIAVLLLLRL
jgi:uncharacterized membrane protein YecN with MAPEG domain